MNITYSKTSRGSSQIPYSDKHLESSKIPRIILRTSDWLESGHLDQLQGLITADIIESHSNVVLMNLTKKSHGSDLDVVGVALF